MPTNSSNEASRKVPLQTEATLQASLSSLVCIPPLNQVPEQGETCPLRTQYPDKHKQHAKLTWFPQISVPVPYISC